MNKIVEILEKNNINGFHLDGGTDKATDHSYDKFYSEILNEYQDKEINLMEIGVQYGGSAVLWGEFFPKAKIVLIDKVNIVHPKIWNLMDKNRCDLIIGDAFTDNTIELLNNKYDGGFDVIIEDGPHTLDSQKFAIKNYSKLLKNGGILIIEDIQDYEHCGVIINEINKNDFKSIEIIDLRKNKNRYDDILIVVKK
jgi:cephalosporin hydroxylase